MEDICCFRNTLICVLLQICVYVKMNQLTSEIIFYSKNPTEYSVPFKKRCVLSVAVYCFYSDISLYACITEKNVYVVFCGKDVNENCCNVLWDNCPWIFNLFLTVMLSDLHGMLCELRKFLLVSLFKWRHVCTNSNWIALWTCSLLYIPF